MNPEIQRCRDEQLRCAADLLAGHPAQHGLRMGLSDWMAEELILSGLWPGALVEMRKGKGKSND